MNGFTRTPAEGPRVALEYLGDFLFFTELQHLINHLWAVGSKGGGSECVCVCVYVCVCVCVDVLPYCESCRCPSHS